MSAPTRAGASGLRLLRRIAPRRASRGFAAAATASKVEAWPQRSPLGPYYDVILGDPTPYRPADWRPEAVAPAAEPEASLPPEEKKPQRTEQRREKKVEKEPEASLPPGEKKPQKRTEQRREKKVDKEPEKTPEPMPSVPPARKKKPGRKPKAKAEVSASPAPSSPSERARIVFASPLRGPAEAADRLATKSAQSTYIAGVLVPPRPEEPDNCCMSGCVNCVWDRYREDMEEWSAKSREAQARLDESGASVDADGGGSDSSWGVRIGGAKIARDLWDDEVFANVPVGIREFMRQEKRLREKRHTGTA